MRRRKASHRPLHYYDPIGAALRTGIREMVQDIVREIARAAIADYTAGIVRRELAIPGGTKTGWRIIDGRPVHWRKAKRLMRRPRR